MNLHQALQPRSLANGFSHVRVEKDMNSKSDHKFLFGKSYPNCLAGATSSQKSTENESPSQDRLVYLTSCLIGHQVDVQVKDGSVFSGIFHATDADNDFGIVLKMARLTKEVSPQGHMAGLDSAGKIPLKILIIPAHELVQVIAKDVAVTCNGESNERQHEKQRELMLDSYISHTRHMEVERELARWVPDEDDQQLPELENIFDSPWTGRSWDQFKVNETLFGVKSTFNEELYTTKLEKGPQMRQLEEEALRIAREIEGEETHDLHLAEERGLFPLGNFDFDEEARFSSVLRTFDDSGFNEEDTMLDSYNGESFQNPCGPMISRHLAESTLGKGHDGGQELSGSLSVDEVQTPLLNNSTKLYQSDSIASENISWGVHNTEEEIRVKDNLISESEQDAFTNEYHKTITQAETIKIDDLPSLLDTHKECFDSGGLSADATEYIPSVVSRKVPEKPSIPSQVSDNDISSKVQGASKSKVHPAKAGTSTSFTSRPAISPSSSVGSFSSEKSTMNPNAKEFKLNPNAESFIPSQTPLRPVSPVAESFYFPASMPSLPHVPGTPISIGVSFNFYRFCLFTALSLLLTQLWCFSSSHKLTRFLKLIDIQLFLFWQLASVKVNENEKEREKADQMQQVGPSYIPPQPLVFNLQAASIQSSQAYFPANGPQYGQPMMIGHPRQVMYMPAYPTEIPYKGHDF